MTAPALIALAHGSRDPRSKATIEALVAETRQMRPDLRIEVAFLDHVRPSFETAVNKLVRARFEEIVVVPLLLSEAFHAKVDVPEVNPPDVNNPSDRQAAPSRSEGRSP